MARFKLRLQLLLNDVIPLVTLKPPRNQKTPQIRRKNGSKTEHDQFFDNLIRSQIISQVPYHAREKKRSVEAGKI